MTATATHHLLNCCESGIHSRALTSKRSILFFKGGDLRIFWQEGGVHQNLTFPVHPDPVSGMHCWHQRVRVEPAQPDDKYGDVIVDTKRSHEIYREWLEKARPAPGPDGLRRPLWFSRPVRPDNEAFIVKD